MALLLTNIQKIIIGPTYATTFPSSGEKSFGLIKANSLVIGLIFAKHILKVCLTDFNYYTNNIDWEVLLTKARSSFVGCVSVYNPN